MSQSRLRFMAGIAAPKLSRRGSAAEAQYGDTATRGSARIQGTQSAKTMAGAYDSGDHLSRSLLGSSVNPTTPGRNGYVDHSDLYRKNSGLQLAPSAINRAISASGDPDVLTPTPIVGRAGASVLTAGSIEGFTKEKRDDTPVVFEEASLRATLFNVVNSVLGAGALGLPYATRLDGMALGAFLIVLIGFFSERTAYFLLHATEHTRARLYSQAAAKLYGPTAGTLVDVTIIVQNLGLLCSYVVVIGDLIPSVISAWAPKGSDGEPYDGTFAPGHPKGRLLVQIISAATVFLPLSSLANLDALKFTSVLAVIAVGATVIAVATISGMALTDDKWIPDAEKLPTLAVSGIEIEQLGDLQLPGPGNGTRLSPAYVVRALPASFLTFLESVPMVFTAYVAHNNILLLYTELRRRSTEERESRFESKKSKMMAAVRVGLGSCCVLYLFIGCFGYLLFREGTESDVLASFKAEQYPFVAWIKLAYAIVIAFSFPLIALALRKSVHAVIFGRDAPVTWVHRIAEAVGCVAVATALGASVPNLGVVTGLTGALAAVQLMYVYPSAMMLRMYWIQGTHGQEDEDEKASRNAEKVGEGALLGGAAHPAELESGEPGHPHRHRPSMPGGTGLVTDLEGGTAWFTLCLGGLVAVLSTVATVI